MNILVLIIIGYDEIRALEKENKLQDLHLNNNYLGLKVKQTPLKPYNIFYQIANYSFIIIFFSCGPSYTIKYQYLPPTVMSI